MHPVPVSAEVLEEFRALLIYDPDNGTVKWRRNHLTYAAGYDAGYIRKDGTRVIWFGDKERAAAPICWALHHGKWPEGRVRFKERGLAELKIANLYVSAGAWKTKEGKNAYGRSHRVANPEIYRNIDLKKDFGIDIIEYAAMLDAQNGVCAICSRPETAIRNGKLKMLAVDHCHTSDAIRGLLCTKCNVMVGMSEDHPERLRAAADYIQKRAGKIVPIRKAAA